MDEEPTDFARTFRAALHSWYADGGADSSDNLVVAASVFNAHQIFAELSKEPRRSALIKARYATFNERGSWIVDADLVRLTLGSHLYGPPPDRLVRLAGFHLGIRRGRGIDKQALQRRSLLEEPQDDVVMKEPAHFRRSVRQRTVGAHLRHQYHRSPTDDPSCRARARRWKARAQAPPPRRRSPLFPWLTLRRRRRRNRPCWPSPSRATPSFGRG